MDVSADDLKSLKSIIEKRCNSDVNNQFLFAKWCTCKSNQNKGDKKRVIILSKFRLFYFKKPALGHFKLRQSLSLIDLSSISFSDNELQILFRTCTAPLIVIGNEFQAKELCVPITECIDVLFKYLPGENVPDVQLPQYLTHEGKESEYTRDEHFQMMYSVHCDKLAIPVNPKTLKTLNEQSQRGTINFGELFYSQPSQSVDIGHLPHLAQIAKPSTPTVKYLSGKVDAVSSALLHTTLFDTFLLRDVSIPDNAMKKITKIFAANDYINNVYMENVHFQNVTSVTKSFAREAKKQSFANLVFRNTHISDAGMKHFSSFLKACQVCNLVLKNCDLGSKGLVSLSEALSSANLKRLSELDLRDNAIEQKGSESLGSWLKQAQHLRSLKVSRCSPGPILEALKNNEFKLWEKKLERLVIQSSTMEKPAASNLQYIVSLTESLKFLNLDKCKFTCTECVSQIFRGFLLPETDSSVPFIVSMRSCHLDKKDAAVIADVLEIITRGSPTNVKSLLLGNNRFDVAGISLLCEKISCLLRLEDLEISGNLDTSLLKKNYSQPAFDTIYKIIKGTPMENLTFLSVAGIGGRISKGGIRPLLTALSDNRSLKELDISKNKIGDFVLSNLGAALKANMTLERINIDGNQTGPLTVGALYDTLTTSNNGSLCEILMRSDVQAYVNSHNSSDDFEKKVAEIYNQVSLNVGFHVDFIPQSSRMHEIVYTSFELPRETKVPDEEFSVVVPNANDEEEEKLWSPDYDALKNHRSHQPSFSVVGEGIFSDDDADMDPALQLLKIDEDEMEEEDLILEEEDDDIDYVLTPPRRQSRDEGVQIHINDPGNSMVEFLSTLDGNFQPPAKIQDVNAQEEMGVKTATKLQTERVERLLKRLGTYPQKKNNPIEAVQPELEEKLNQQTIIVQNLSKEVQSEKANQQKLQKTLTRQKTMVEDLSNKIEEFEDERLCQICFEAPKDILLQDCGHFMYCHECVGELDTCPTCRKPILGKIKVFQ